jgi:hypothetical protein
MKDFLEKLVSLVPLLEPYPAWTKILISAWVLLSGVVVISLVFFKPSKIETQARNIAGQQPPTQVLAPSVSPAIVSAESVEALRRIDGVRELRLLENDLNLSRLAPGVFGFTVPWIINTDPGGVVGGTGVDRISLQQSSLGTAVMEVHKRPDSEIYVIGYVSDTDLVRLQNPSRKADADVTLFFASYREFSHPVAIPISRITASENRSVGDQYVNDLSVR